ncbi:hypothetical protein K440DRAFT_656964 [Wilcoxina mikolae CBS 423.85]|nr:hypothetical protein K440DRAFT_656964 [Wilcoxina mikolae CBS 423.85]
MHLLLLLRTMSTPHSVRTSTHPRSPTLHTATITHILTLSPHLRQIILSSPSPIPHKPGQWIDLHLPSLPQPGGFTITSPPSSSSSSPTLSLSIRAAPENPAAAWLWQKQEDVLGKEVKVRVGGAFVFPPPGVDRGEVERVVMLAGGVGVNPFLSMVGWIRGDEEWGGVEVRVLWSGRVGEFVGGEVLRGVVEVFETDGNGGGRIKREDLERVVKEEEEEAGKTLVFVCGPKGFAEFCMGALEEMGVEMGRVYCEKWW